VKDRADASGLSNPKRKGTVMETSARQAGSQPMQCMEIWGSSGAIDSGISTPGLDIWVLGKPYEGAANGGDIHYVSLCGGGITTRIIVADVSGHGDAVASVALSLRTLMRRHINRKNPTQLVKGMDREFSALAPANCFATAVVGTYLASCDQLTVCNAGHPRPLWYRAARGEWSVLSPQRGGQAEVRRNLPLGLDEDATYNQMTVQLGLDDVVLVYTDALIEAVNEAGQPLLEGGLLGMVRHLDAGNPADLGRDLLGRLDHYRGGRPANDDVTILTMHHTASQSARLSFGQKLDMYAKVSRSAGTTDCPPVESRSEWFIG
jgi:phosphoserine phosphatase RsbU/P